MNTYLILAIVFSLITLALFTLTVKHASKGERSAMWSGFTIVSLVVTVIVVGVYQQEKLYYNPKEIADNVLSKQIQDVVHAYYLTDDYYEAADIDGASRWKKFIHITLPSIRGQLLFTIVTTTIAQFNIYGQPLMMTNGGPNGSTTVLMMNVQQNAFGSGQSLAGISSAMAVILGICITIVSMVQLFLLKNKD